MKRPVIASADLLRALRELDPRALLRRSTWRAIVAPEAAASAVPRLGITGRTGRSSEVLGQASLRFDEPQDWPDLPPFGVREQDGMRVWTVPLWVHYSAQSYVGRVAAINGQPVLRAAELMTAMDQVPGLIGLVTGNGEWASGDPPNWIAVPDDRAEEAFPPSPDGAPAFRLLATLSLGALGVYVRRPFEFVRF